MAAITFNVSNSYQSICVTKWWIKQFKGKNYEKKQIKQKVA